MVLVGEGKLLHVYIPWPSSTKNCKLTERKVLICKWYWKVRRGGGESTTFSLVRGTIASLNTLLSKSYSWTSIVWILIICIFDYPNSPLCSHFFTNTNLSCTRSHTTISHQTKQRHWNNVDATPLKQLWIMIELATFTCYSNLKQTDFHCMSG